MNENPFITLSKDSWKMEIMHSELQKRKNFENQYLEILSKDVRKIPFLKESNEGGKFLVCGIFRIGSTFEILVFHQVSPAGALRGKVIEGGCCCMPGHS